MRGRRAVLALLGLLAGAAGGAAIGATGEPAPAVKLRRAAASAADRPNVLLVVVDTLRADHLGVYGWPVPTSPNLEATLAARGVVVERAYSQAPWTIPSMVALFSGRWPGELMGRTIAQYGLPPGLVSLPMALQAAGYETAAFVANPSLDPKVGFERGFDRYYLPQQNDPDNPQWDHADHLTRLAKQWLRARPRERPFFLYVHYVEPHDPYASPELVAGRSPYYPDYRGIVDGTWPHGLMLGKIRVRDASDVRHLRALYDSEVHWVDRWLGALLAGVDEATAKRTFFVFTADHGEELFDHSGWKHGRTVFEEQLRVPLVMRWDGRLPAGRRIEGPVRLMDVAPTLLAAAGVPAPRGWQGENLLPLLRGQVRPGFRPASYAAHFLDGPRRAAATLGRWKLTLFDRSARVSPPDEYEKLLYRGEMARLPRLALFDLLADPHERRDRAAERPDLVAGLGGIVHDHLGREAPGLRVVLAGVGLGAEVVAELRFRRPPASWEPYFLGPADRVELEGDRLRLTLVGEALPKGVLLPEGTEIAAAGVLSPPGVVVRLGGGAIHRGGAVAAAAMRRDGWPAPMRPELLLWQPVRTPTPAVPSDPETRRRLRALGYTG
jgi:arylsulfatase A-like enzyme